MTRNFKEQLADVRAFAFDVDGVLTNGTVILHPSGELVRTSNTRDGYAMHKAIEMGYPIAIISGGDSMSLRKRFEGLGISDIFLGKSDKCAALEEFSQKHGLQMSQILYMGDDLPDYHAMKMVGIPTCPQNADSEIKQISLYISDFDGGNGCARDVIEQVLRLNGHWGPSSNGKMQ